MRFPRRLVPAAAATSLMALPAIADGGAAKRVAVPCWNADAGAWTYPVKPKRCGTYESESTEAAAFVLSGLSWTKYGAAHAVGKGEVKTTPDAYNGKITLDARGLKRCSARLSIYTSLTVSAPHLGDLTRIRKVPCPK